MGRHKMIIPPVVSAPCTTIKERVKSPSGSENIAVDFSEFRLSPIKIQGEFNNYFKNEEHFCMVSSSFLSVILPKITGHPFREICEGSAEGRVLHFHTVDDEHKETVRKILSEYSFSDEIVEQMFEGNSIFEFSATLGHTYAARVVCHKIDNILHLLFLDTNHHIYMNTKYIEESLFYECCPEYINGECKFMPGECFAVGYLDELKMRESFGYGYSPD